MKDINVFYHLYIPDTSGMWVWWVDEQLGILEKFGLSEVAKVNMCITMPTGLTGKIKRFNHTDKFDPLTQDSEYIEKTYEETVLGYIMHRYPFVNILNVRGINEENIYEGQTLDQVYEYAKKNDGYVFYFHSKGVLDSFFKGFGIFGQDRKWRQYMQKHCVENWRECVKKLDEGYGAVGTHFDTNYYPFAGNFWWATTEHIKRLENPLKPELYNAYYTKDNYRFNFEKWIGTKNPKIYYIDTLNKEESEKVYLHAYNAMKDHPVTSSTNKEVVPIQQTKEFSSIRAEKFNLCRIVPDNGFDIHAQVFHEIEASVFFTLQRMGYEVTNSVNEFKSNARNIVFGMHHCPVDVVRHDLPKNTIIYSLEQMRDQPECMRWCRKYRGLEVWDYSMRNTEVLRKAGVENIKHFKIGYVPELSYFERNRPEERDIDILAYMSPSSRRTAVMDIFEKDPNINFVAVQSTYGDERDKLIKRAKLVINLHNHDNEIFEMVRVSHLIQNKVPVISERNTTTDFPDYMEGTVNTASYKDFVAKTYELLKDVNKLDRQAEQGLEIFKKSPMENFLKEVL